MFDVINAFILGVSYGIGPCTLSCAPLMVPLIMSTSKDQLQGTVNTLIFSIARIISYSFLGFLSGFLGTKIDALISSKMLGGFLILLGLAVMFKVQGRCILKSKKKIKGSFMLFITGIIWGLSPCPPLIALLVLAAASKSALTGILMGLVFGLGTIISPLLILGFFSGWFAKNKEFINIIPYIAGGFILLLGILYSSIG